ncbi:hydrogenase maturation protein [Crenothrix polyspora]|uniref:Hydrogenase maturation factor HoxX n=1 Tax=Crenothrix polyspora TaxID=360316 RepID=A0A1R4H8K1_9GAMM|nr:hydrogenase maturation protein [Crenothrix polyspora]SJM92190.1 Hydrogenase maturation factor HoxX [Crenothrix polyspora]
MRILLVSSAFSGLTQRFYTELVDAGYIVSVELHSGDMAQLQEGVDLFQPDLILCPFLTKRLPKEIYERIKCLIVHPGIKGDCGPSSLDWAIQEGKTEWGVTLLEAAEDMDAGDVWASKNFPLRNTTKSNSFYRDVTQAAVDCLWQALSFFDAPHFKPELQDYTRADYKGTTRPSMKQQDRAINWKKHKTDEILRRIHAADGSPGVLDNIYGLPVFLFNAHKEHTLRGNPGDIIATANHAICRATVDGAVWIGHLKAQLTDGAKGIKLPATFVLKNVMPKTTSATSPLKNLFSKAIKVIDIDYTQPGRQLPCQEVWYEQDDNIAYLNFHFHNGAMSTEQCRLLLSVYQHVATLPVKAIVLLGGDASFSNGIHLNHIEAADSSADESWLNINAIDDLIYQIITTVDKVTIAALAGSAGAGGAMMPLAADKVFTRDGVIFNAHYKNMGELYGSEYWTYLLPKRVGQDMALALTEQRLPISAKKAWQIKLIDKVLDKRHDIFIAQVKLWVKTLVNDNVALQKFLTAKANTRCDDEAIKAVANYRKAELTKMYENFYGDNRYHQARQRFVYKVCEKCTPGKLAIHRDQPSLFRKAEASG